MKNLTLILLVLALFACNEPATDITGLQQRIAGLEKQLQDTYKPGFGELMSGIQAHHAKLWFAGKYQNWKLADFEIHELIEGLESIEKYQKERKESEEIGMIKPALNEMQKAIKAENPQLFKANYEKLTKSCNDCHEITDFGFNIVKVPPVSAFPNQGWELKK